MVVGRRSRLCAQRQRARLSPSSAHPNDWSSLPLAAVAEVFGALAPQDAAGLRRSCSAFSSVVPLPCARSVLVCSSARDAAEGRTAPLPIRLAGGVRVLTVMLAASPEREAREAPRVRSTKDTTHLLGIFNSDGDYTEYQDERFLAVAFDEEHGALLERAITAITGSLLPDASRVIHLVLPGFTVSTGAVERALSCPRLRALFPRVSIAASELLLDGALRGRLLGAHGVVACSSASSASATSSASFRLGIGRRSYGSVENYRWVMAW
jgi:hypothetical protein